MSISKAFDTELAQIALSAANSVAPYLRKVARTAPTTANKRDIHDPVTVHDRHVEKELRSFLSLKVPGSRILGEELGEDSALIPPSMEQAQSYQQATSVQDLGVRVRWIIDPIDGTANFAAGLTYFGTSIACELDGKIVAAAITIPCNNESFVANSSRFWHVNSDGVEQQLHADGPSSEEKALLASYYPGLGVLETTPEIGLRHEVELLQAHSAVRRPGAGALDLANVAAGWIGVSLGVGFGPWDVAAGIHMVKVAGGEVLNLPMGTDLPDGLRPAVVASGANLDAVTAKRVLEEVNAKVEGDRQS